MSAITKLLANRNPEVLQALQRLAAANQTAQQALDDATNRGHVSPQVALAEANKATREVWVAFLNQTANSERMASHVSGVKAVALKEGAAMLPRLLRLQSLGHIEPACRIAIITAAVDLMNEAGADVPAEYLNFIATDGLLPEIDTLETLHV